MLETIAKNWWVFALRGVLAIVFGILAFVRPDITLVALVALFGTYALLDGIFALIAAPMLSGSSYFWWVLLDGVLGIAAGVLTFIYPHAATVTLLAMLGAWLIFSGVFRIALAIELHKVIDNEWMVSLGGLLSVAAGALTFYRPVQSAVAWLWIIGIYAMAYGLTSIVTGFRLHSLGAGATPGEGGNNRDPILG